MIYNNVDLHNVSELVEEKEGQGLIFSRIPNELRLKISQNSQKNALQFSGCEVRFNMLGETAKVILIADNSINKLGPALGEIYYGCFFDHSFSFVIPDGQKSAEIEIKKRTDVHRLERLTNTYNLPFDANLIRVVLPYGLLNCRVEVEGEVTPPKACQVPAKKCLSYGSSITHGASSVCPSGTYAMRTAQRLGVDLINLGFAGSAMLDKEMADYIANRQDWDFATLEMGINVFEEWSAEQFKEKADYFIEKIATSNPNKHVFCTDLFTYSYDFEPEHINYPKLQEYRAIVREKVQSLSLPNLHYITGKDLLINAAGLSTDLVHPAFMGAEEISINLSNFILSKLI